MILLSLLSSDNTRLTKRLYLNENNTLAKDGTTHLYSGHAKTVELNDLEAFSTLLDSVESNQCLTYGTPVIPEAKIITKKAWEDNGRPSDSITRSREHFQWPDSPGILMLDYDPPAGQEPLSRDELLEALYKGAPAIKNAPHLWRASASSCIYNSETGDKIQGVTGQRIYIVVENAKHIPEIGKAINIRLWSQGHGHIAISRAGAQLTKGLFDTSVWQPERIDYVASPVCEYPVEQRRPNSTMLGGDQHLTLKDVKISTNRLRQYEDILKQKRSDVIAKADDVREEYIKIESKKLAESKNIDLEKAVTLLQSATSRTQARLFADFTLISETGKQVTVEDILNNKEKWDQTTFLDPLEPEYHNHKPVAKAFLFGGRPVIHSFAHGRSVYFLQRQTKTIKVDDGCMTEAAIEAADILKLDNIAFNRGGETVFIKANGQIENGVKSVTSFIIGQNIHFEKYDERSKRWVAKDCPDKLESYINANASRLPLNILQHVLTAPTLRADGSILASYGYDAQSQNLLIQDHNNPVLPIEEYPSIEDVIQALQRLLQPFKDFPFVDATDIAVFLSCLFTTALRPSLPTGKSDNRI